LLFLDSYAGIPTKKLRGLTKAYDYKIGHDITGSGTWAAVYVDNNWRFVDAHWGSSHVTKGGADDDWVLVTDEGESAESKGPCYIGYQMNDFYFFTDPEVFVYNHLPQDKDWQLLARPVEYSEFKEMAFLRAGYFACDFVDLSQRKCLLKSNKGQINIAFDMPKRSYLQFSSKFYKSSDMTGTNLKRFVYTDTRGDKTNINVKFQMKGRYKLTVSAG
jgi:transglutaminase/protease-like cytokinesis protein 3